MASLQNVAGRFVAGHPKQSERTKTQEAGVTDNKSSAPGSSKDTFEELFLSCYARVVTTLRRIVGDPSQAEDLASEVFLKLYLQPPPQNRSGNISGWLYRTATNLGIDSLRASARRNRLEQDAARQGNSLATNETVLDTALRAERQQQVRAVLAELKPAQAQLLLLRASGYSYKELASALELEAGSIGTLLVRAEAAFAQRYSELFGREEDL